MPEQPHISKTLEKLLKYVIIKKKGADASTSAKKPHYGFILELAVLKELLLVLLY